MLNNPGPHRFGVTLSGGEEHVQNRAPQPAAPCSNSRCVHPCQGDRGMAITHRPYFAQDSPEPADRSLLHPRAVEPEKPGLETCSPAPFLPFLPPPALTVSRSAPAAGTLGLSKRDVKKGCVQEHCYSCCFPLSSARATLSCQVSSLRVSDVTLPQNLP